MEEIQQTAVASATSSCPDPAAMAAGALEGSAREQPRDSAHDAKLFGRNLAFLGGGQLFTWTMTLAWTLIVPRLLGPSGIGMITTGMSVAGILQILLSAGSAVYVAREAVVSPERAGRLVVTAAIVRILLVPVFAAALATWVALAHYGHEQDLVLFLCGGATVLMMLQDPMASYFQATERMHFLAISDALNKAAQGLGGIALAVAGVGAVGFGWCWIVSAGLVVVLSVRWLRRYERVRLTTTVADLKDVIRGSLVYWATGLFFMIYLWIDTAMLSLMTNPTVVGWYGVPTRLFGTMLVIPTIFSRAWLPQLVRAYQSSPETLARVARPPIERVFALALPIAALIAAVAGPGIRLVYGHGYVHAIPVLIILGLALIPMYLNIMLNQVCVAAGRQRLWTWLMVGATIVNPAINGVLIPITQHRYGNGAIGAGIALGLTELLVAAGGLVIVGREVIGTSMLVRTVRMLPACACMILITHFTRQFDTYLSLACGCAGMLVALLALGAIKPEERLAARDGVVRLARWLAALAGIGSGTNAEGRSGVSAPNQGGPADHSPSGPEGTDPTAAITGLDG